MTRLLIVDRHSADEDTYRDFLQGYDLLFVKETTAESSLALVNRALDAGTVVDAAIVLWQPTGAETMVALQRRLRNVPIIAIDETLNRSIFDAARRLGAVEFLLKPLEEDALRQAVQRALGEGALTEVVDELKRRLIGESRVWRVALENLARAIRRVNEQVLLIGETGTGKELAARAIHDFGVNAAEPFVAVNAGAVQPHLLESELFGHEKGAFTDAHQQRAGLFERCERGTLFLDEIGELPEPLQAKLLRGIQERSFRRVGGDKELPFAGRLLCATNKNLAAEVKERRFRADLYHRINTHEVHLPPLRERRGDWLLLAQHFLDKHSAPGTYRLSAAARSVLADSTWPGNAREVENAMLHCLSHQPSGVILPSHLPQVPPEREALGEQADDGMAYPSDWFSLSQKEAIEMLEAAFNREYLNRVLIACHGNVTQAAKRAGLDPKTFRSKWERAGLEPLKNREHG